MPRSVFSSPGQHRATVAGRGRRHALRRCAFSSAAARSGPVDVRGTGLSARDVLQALQGCGAGSLRRTRVPGANGRRGAHRSTAPEPAGRVGLRSAVLSGIGWGDVSTVASALYDLSDGMPAAMCELWNAIAEADAAETSDGILRLTRPIEELAPAWLRPLESGRRARLRQRRARTDGCRGRRRSPPRPPPQPCLGSPIGTLETGASCRRTRSP